MQINITHKNGCYPVFIGNEILTSLASVMTGTQVFIVTDENVAPHYLHVIQNKLNHFSCDTLILSPGEKHKNFTAFQSILDHCVNHHHHRDTTFIALGGGVVSDLTGFAAACYHRGVNWIAIPTTLLAQVDASVGGKTAINHAMGKNLIGAFYPPSAVFIDLQTLSTLPKREFRSGIAEIIKAALIADAQFFDWLENNISKLLRRDSGALHHAVKRSIEIKRDIVEKDERENGLRAILNFGHTIAHAIEKCDRYESWLHGEAVFYGMLAESKLSLSSQKLNQPDFNRIKNLLNHYDFVQPLPSHITPSDLINAMQNDKKNKLNQIRFVLLNRIGEAVVG